MSKYIRKNHNREMIRITPLRKKHLARSKSNLPVTRWDTNQIKFVNAGNSAVMRYKNKTRLWFLGKSGQGLIEYLILVALMGVATIGVIRVLNQTVKARFAGAIYALQGKPKKVKTESLKEQDYKKSDMSDFMNGAASNENKSKKKK